MQPMTNNGKQVFSRVGGIQPRRSVFDLSYEKKLTCDMGQLIPIMCDEVVPGDVFHIGNQALVRFMPMVAPIMHEINMYVHYFFVPYRILWSDWENWITGGADGAFVGTLPTWSPSVTVDGSLWDYLGFPTGIVPTGSLPMAFPKEAYNTIYNQYYRDETLIAPIDVAGNEYILNRAWEKDYFTSSLPWQQRGTAPALPISGTTHAIWTNTNISASAGNVNVQVTNADATTPVLYANNANAQTNLKNALNSNTVDLSTATTFNVADLRLVFQIQKWLERNARAGSRYTEFLQSHFGVSPRDERLQRPEYIGGTKAPIIISEVLQTSESATTPQGTLAGHGITVSQGFAGKYHAKEFGLIMGIMSIMPRTNYQQGINRQWLRRTKYDFYFPEFANLSEQAILNVEILAKADSTHNNTIFGYQGRYDEMRTKTNMVCSEMRDTFSYWHLGRIFNPATPPALNKSFIECFPDKRIFAVQNKPGLMVQFGNLIKAFRPMPIQSEPGLIDHN